MKASRNSSGKNTPNIPIFCIEKGANTSNSGKTSIKSKLLSRSDPARVLRNAQIARNPMDSFSIFCVAAFLIENNPNKIIIILIEMLESNMKVLLRENEIIPTAKREATFKMSPMEAMIGEERYLDQILY